MQENVTPQQTGTQQTPVVDVNTQQQPNVTAGLPDGTSQRTTEQFQKVLQSNNALHEQNQLLQRQLQQLQEAQGRIEQEIQQHSTNATNYSSTQNTQVQPSVPLQSPTVNPNDFVEIDPETGEKFINSDRLNAAIQATRQAAVAESSKVVQDYIQNQQKQEELRQIKEAYENYPSLNPNSSDHDTEFARLTRQILTDSYGYQQDYGGFPLTFKQAADQALSYVNAIRKGASQAQAQAEVKKVADEQKAETEVQQQKATQEAEQAKQAAAADVTGASQAGQSQVLNAELTELRYQTRRGSVEALAARLARLGK